MISFFTLPPCVQFLTKFKENRYKYFVEYMTHDSGEFVSIVATQPISCRTCNHLIKSLFIVNYAIYKLLGHQLLTLIRTSTSTTKTPALNVRRIFESGHQQECLTFGAGVDDAFQEKVLDWRFGIWRCEVLGKFAFYAWTHLYSDISQTDRFHKSELVKRVIIIELGKSLVRFDW